MIQISRDGAVIDRIDEAELASRVATGVVLPSDHYWKAGMDQWELVQGHPSLAPKASVPVAALPRMRLAKIQSFNEATCSGFASYADGTQGPFVTARAVNLAPSVSGWVELVEERGEVVSAIPSVYAPFEQPQPEGQVLRSSDEKLIAGVCAGVARKYGFPIWLVRLLTFIACLIPIVMLVTPGLYIFVWSRYGSGPTKPIKAKPRDGSLLEEDPKVMAYAVSDYLLAAFVRGGEITDACDHASAMVMNSGHRQAAGRVLAAALGIIVNRHDGIVDDPALSPQQYGRFSHLKERLHLPDTYTQDVNLALSRRFLRWRRAHEPLPVVNVDIALERDEVCHSMVCVDYHQYRKRVTARHYNGISSSFKIIKGVYWRTGNFAVSREHERLREKVTLAGSMPKGGAFSCVLSGSQARKAVADALVEVQPLAAALDGEDGYPIGPDGLMDAKVLRLTVEGLGMHT